MGICFSCGKFRFLINQTNFGVQRRMCKECCEAAKKVERLMSPVEPRATKPKTSWDWEGIMNGTYQETRRSVPSNWLEIYLNENGE